MKLFLGYRRQFLVSSLFVISLAANTAIAQTDKPSPQASPQASATPSPPAANPADVSSIDAIVTAVYEVHSGDQGKKRDWDRMRSLFVPGARLILPRPPQTPGGYSWRVAPVEDYITKSFPFLEQQDSSKRRWGGGLRLGPISRRSSAPTNHVARPMIPNPLCAASTAFN